MIRNAIIIDDNLNKLLIWIYSNDRQIVGIVKNESGNELPIDLEYQLTSKDIGKALSQYKIVLDNNKLVVLEIILIRKQEQKAYLYVDGECRFAHLPLEELENKNDWEYVL